MTKARISSMLDLRVVKEMSDQYSTDGRVHAAVRVSLHCYM